MQISLPCASTPIIDGNRANAEESAVINGRQPLEAATHDHRSAECLTFVQDEIDVVADLEDAVARTDAGHCYEAIHRGNGQRLPDYP